MIIAINDPQSMLIAFISGVIVVGILVFAWAIVRAGDDGRD